MCVMVWNSGIVVGESLRDPKLSVNKIFGYENPNSTIHVQLDLVKEESGGSQATGHLCFSAFACSQEGRPASGSSHSDAKILPLKLM